MEKSDRRPFKRFLDRSNNIHFKVVSTNNGLFNLYESKDNITWKLSKKGQTLLEIMEIQTSIVNSNLLNYINFLSILKRKPNEKAVKRNRKMD
jgi:hypothetical protein